MIDNLFEKLQNAQAQVEETKKQLDAVLIDEKMEGISVTVTANRDIREISIDESLIAEGDKEQIEDILITVLNKAMTRAKETEDTHMQSNAQSMLGGLM